MQLMNFWVSNPYQYEGGKNNEVGACMCSAFIIKVNYVVFCVYEGDRSLTWIEQHTDKRSRALDSLIGKASDIRRQVNDILYARSHVVSREGSNHEVHIVRDGCLALQQAGETGSLIDRIILETATRDFVSADILVRLHPETIYL